MRVVLRRSSIGAVALALLSLVIPAAATALSANGKIAFVSFRDGDPEVYTMNPDGSQPTRLTFNTGPSPELPLLDFWPSWRSDGRKIVYTSFRLAGPGMINPDVWVMNPDGSGNTRITTHPAGDLDPVFSPDGRKIVFVREFPGPDPEGEPVQDIWSVNADGTGEVNLTRSAENETEPAFSPDGRKIVFERALAGATHEGGNHEIFTMNPDGSNVTRLTFTEAAAEQHPSFSPDGRRIAFDTNFHAPPGVGGHIFSMNADGTGRTPLTGNRTDRHGLASYSPDGTKIVFTASEDIWLMNPDGSDQRPLTRHPTPDIQPSWQPVARAARPPTALRAGACANERRGTARSETIDGTVAGDRLLGFGGNDWLVGRAGDDCLGGGTGRDRLSSGSGPDRLVGNSGSDRLAGYSGRDSLSGGSGNDRLKGGSSGDRLSGGTGRDRLAGGSGNDRLSGGSRGDRLSGGRGRDRLSGGAGNDRIISADGRRERVNCGTGRDRVVADRGDRLRGCERVRFR